MVAERDYIIQILKGSGIRESCLYDYENAKAGE